MRSAGLHARLDRLACQSRPAPQLPPVLVTLTDAPADAIQALFAPGGGWVAREPGEALGELVKRAAPIIGERMLFADYGLATRVLPGV